MPSRKEGDFAIPEVPKDGCFGCAAATDDAMAAMGLRGVGKRGFREDPAEEEGPGRPGLEWSVAEEDPAQENLVLGGAVPGRTLPKKT